MRTQFIKALQLDLSEAASTSMQSLLGKASFWRTGDLFYMCSDNLVVFIEMHEPLWISVQLSSFFFMKDCRVSKRKEQLAILLSL